MHEDKSDTVRNVNTENTYLLTSVTRLGDILDFGQLFKAFGNN